LQNRSNRRGSGYRQNPSQFSGIQRHESTRNRPMSILSGQCANLRRRCHAGQSAEA
jgi:hypothetical protein